MPTIKLKERVVNLLGGACSRCSYNRCHRALQLHHIDPTTKKKRTHHNSILRHAEQHPELFTLLCANCHFEEHEAQDLARMPSAVCRQCSREYKVRNYVHKLGTTHYCSRACQVQSLVGRPGPRSGTGSGFASVTCLSCHRDFTVRAYLLKKGRGRYCSRECQYSTLRKPRKSVQGAVIVGSA